MAKMVTKRPLKTFPIPPNITEKMEEEGERVIRVQESWNSLVDKRLMIEYLRPKDDQLVKETEYAIGKLKTVSHKLDKKRRIIYEDSRAKMIDGMEKLTTPCPFNKQVMFGRDKEISDIKAAVLEGVNNKFSWGKMTENKTVIIIDGKAGTGKTMLARLIFDDDDVCKVFYHRHWINCEICDDTDDRFFDLLLEEITSQSYNNMLIVLDGFSTRHNMKFIQMWQHNYYMEQHLLLRILITAPNLSFRCVDDGYEIDNVPKPFHLPDGLANEESRALFESLAFSSETISNVERTRIIDSDIISTLINKCANNPCVVTTIASILSTKTTLEEWRHFLDFVLLSLPNVVETIASVFNLVAFKRLTFLMKRSLLYCSLFPKDYEFSRVDLNLWLAREFKFNSLSIDMVDDVELSGDEYLRRLHEIGYFVEHAKINDDTLSYKMPLFSYEFVKFVAKLDYSEYQSVGTSARQVDLETVRHLSFIADDVTWHPPPWLSEAKNLQSLNIFGQNYERITDVENIIASLKHLQILSIEMAKCEHLVSYIGDLELLRSLRLRITSPHLPQEFVTRMQNLSVFDLENSSAHIILAEEFQRNAQNLRHLYLGKELDKMGLSSGELVSLSKANVFAMGRIDSLLDYNYILENQTTDSLISDDVLEDINKVSQKSLIWVSPCRGDDDIVINALQPTVTLKSLSIRCWKGLTFPQFFDIASIQIADSHEFECLSPLGTLLKLKSLRIRNLSALKYIQKLGNVANKASTQPQFPSLETLTLANLPKLEAWTDCSSGQSTVHQQIPRLIKLEISNTKLNSMPPIKTLESLEVSDISTKLLEELVSGESSSWRTMKMLNISRVRKLASLLILPRVLELLIIRQCHELTTLEARDTRSLKELQLHDCNNLKDPSKALVQMTRLEKLEINGCQDFDLHNTTIPWPSFNNIRHLKLVNLSYLESLPSGLDCLTALETMWICWVYNLRDLPEWIGSFGHLQRLVVRNCPSLSRIPKSLGKLLDDSSVLQIEFRCCRALTKLPESFSRDQLSRLIIRECPKLERTLRMN